MHHSVYSSRILVVWQFTFTGILYSTLQRCKIFGNVTVKNYLNERCCRFCASLFTVSVPSRKGFWCELSKMYLIASLVLPLIVNMLFVSINFSLEKDFAEIFPAFVNFNIFELNKFAYVCWNVIREHFCGMDRFHVTSSFSKIQNQRATTVFIPIRHKRR